MKSSILGLIAGLFIVGYSVGKTTDDFTAYLNIISILIVFGGTISAAVITHGAKRIKDIFLMFFKAFKTSRYTDLSIISEIVQISKAYKNGKSLEEISSGQLHPYTKDGLRLIHNQFDEDKIINISKRMLFERTAHYKASIDQLEVLAKYPPAFGMMGTIIGLIAVMKNLGSEASIETVGPSMAVALITTLYGIFLANYVIHPICDNLSSRSERDLKVRRIISEGILLINRKEDPIYVREMLMAYLLPTERELFIQTDKVENIRTAA